LVRENTSTLSKSVLASSASSSSNFCVGGHRIERVFHGLVDGAVDADLDASSGCAGQTTRSPAISGGTVAEKNSVCRSRGQRPMMSLHDRQEAHVEHAVHFVEHEDLISRRLIVPVLEVIHQAAGRGDDDVDAAFQFGALDAVADAAEDGDRADIGEAGEIAKRRLDLRREFARGFEHEHPRAGRAWRGA
jgi:hypothetical protein